MIIMLLKKTKSILPLDYDEDDSEEEEEEEELFDNRYCVVVRKISQSPLSPLLLNHARLITRARQKNIR